MDSLYTKGAQSLKILICMMSVVVSFTVYADNELPKDTIPLHSEGVIKKSVYSQALKNKSDIYNTLWGKHYREVYSTPISVHTPRITSLLGRLERQSQSKQLRGIYYRTDDNHLYLLRPLGGSSSFVQSDFFQEMYNKEDFEDTYLNEFIGDAYTIINPYTFVAADYLAKEAGLNYSDPLIYYIPQNATLDTIADGSSLEDRLVSIWRIPDAKLENILITSELLDSISNYKDKWVDQELYIRERVFDILVGDWNKIPENWRWVADNEGDSTVYTPIVVDRNHAFTKVDGFLFKQMLNVLTLGFIYNYDSDIKNVRKFNTLGFPLDMAITTRSDEESWKKQVEYIQTHLTDEVIEKAFNRLPPEIQGEEIEEIKRKLRERRENLPDIVHRYFDSLQDTPVLKGTEGKDRFVINRYGSDSTKVELYNGNSGDFILQRTFSKEKTREIWIYGLDDDDIYEVRGEADKNVPVFLIGGRGENSYQIENGNKVRIYEYNSEKDRLQKDSVGDAKVILSDNEKVHVYDYNKVRYDNLSFTPWGFYDSDLGLNIGSFLTYTLYGFKRSPFTYQHRIGYNYLEGFMYRGIFPDYDDRRSLQIDATIGTPRNFTNFFGFGNETPGYKDEGKKYNRVDLRRYTLTPSLHYKLNEPNKIIAALGFEVFDVEYKEGRLIDEYYGEDDSVFDTKFFADASLTWQMSKPLSSFVSLFDFSITGGWKLNIGEVKRNYPYAQAELGFNFKFTDRITLATLLNGRALFNNKYEFYQAAAARLRGYRINRFIGKQSFYQYSELRLDMGKLKNPFTPLKYGLFGGVDYGRVWYPHEHSDKWHVSYGGGAWLTIINKITTKYSVYGSGDTVRFIFDLGFGF